MSSTSSTLKSETEINTKYHEYLGRCLNHFNLISKPFVKFHLKKMLGSKNWEAKFRLHAASTGGSGIFGGKSEKLVFDTQLIIFAFKLYWNDLFAGVLSGQNISNTNFSQNDKSFEEIGVFAKEEDIFFENIRFFCPFLFMRFFS